MEDYYSILGVSPTATSEEINERFRFLAQAYHPDKFSAEKQKRQAEEEFKKFNEAYQVLSNPARRLDYDRRRNPRAFEAAEAARRRAQDEKRKREEAERQRQELDQRRRDHEKHKNEDRVKSKNQDLERPAFVDGTICRMVRSGELVVVEIWGPKGWERGNLSIGEVAKAPPASEETLTKLGVPKNDWK